jgi:AraC-like DNA-binding protein
VPESINLQANSNIKNTTEIIDSNIDAEFDVIGDILETLRFRGSIFFRSDLAAPWGMSLKRMNIPRFHIALKGSCMLGSDASATVKVEHMDIVMLPKGNSHWIADKPGRTLVPSDAAGEACELGQAYFQKGEITNRLMCGLVQFDQQVSHPILENLPQIMHFSDIQENDPIWISVTLIDLEMQRAKSRSGRIVDRLTEVLFLQLLNRFVSQNQETKGFLMALGDRRVNSALVLIHSEPQTNWTLNSLGERSGMSRATLVRHFQDAVGVAPMTYIANWKLMTAYNRVKYSSASLEQVAESVGFASARSLSRAFRRTFKITPSELRRKG